MHASNEEINTKMPKHEKTHGKTCYKNKVQFQPQRRIEESRQKRIRDARGNPLNGLMVVPWLGGISTLRRIVEMSKQGDKEPKNANETNKRTNTNTGSKDVNKTTAHFQRSTMKTHLKHGGRTPR